MADKVVEIFRDAPDGIFIDATFGLGGHSTAILSSLGNKFSIIGIDRDAEMLACSESGRPSAISLRNMRFSGIPEMIRDESLGAVGGILFDLGLNSAQLDDVERGFSFSQSGPIDMRFDRAAGAPASHIIGKLNEKELTTILKDFGQERHSRAIARAIIREKPQTTDQLMRIVEKIVGGRHLVKSAARVFQAIRIFVNNELEELRVALEGAIPLLAPGGRIAVISYHSLEDGIVKRQFLLNSGRCFCGPQQPVCVCGRRKLLKILSKKPVMATDDEIRSNPRARSARLRYAEKI